MLYFSLKKHVESKIYATSFNKQGSRVIINRIHIYLEFTWDRFYFCGSNESYLRRSCKNAPSKICDRQPSKHFTWFILDYLILSCTQNISIMVI